ncbi:hypothetical protein CJ030_MR8G027410 [Morella rubra]|uniref:Uncharacterized protein n=1 Tax=Morella rubra TaxID=262757 RepID=A0A6A1UWQ6_9ROSI|nr:hypothetical protein CJ030_MR8G027410 [Morella rubra]
MYKATHSCGNPTVWRQNDAVPATTLPQSFPSSPHRNEQETLPHHHPTTRIAPSNTAPIMLPAAADVVTWLRSSRIRYCLLLLCSPLLLPFLCAAFPLLCAAELWLRYRRRRRKDAHGCRGDESLRRCEEGCGCGVEEEEEEVGLLQRYLEDQMLLVGSVYDCGDDEDYDAHRDGDDGDRNVGFGGTSSGSRTPLLG